MADSEIDRVLAGQCLHGHTKDCAACAITVYQVVTLRRPLDRMFGGRRG